MCGQDDTVYTTPDQCSCAELYDPHHTSVVLYSLHPPHKCLRHLQPSLKVNLLYASLLKLKKKKYVCSLFFLLFVGLPIACPFICSFCHNTTKKQNNLTQLLFRVVLSLYNHKKNVHSLHSQEYSLCSQEYSLHSKLFSIYSQAYGLCIQTWFGITTFLNFQNRLEI